MRFRFKFIFSFICCLLLTSIAVAQPSFKATVNPTVIGMDGYATLRLVLENTDQPESITPSIPNGFAVVSGPNRETGMSDMNGKISQYTAISYVLQPKKLGKFTIPAAKAVAGGKQYSSNAVTLTVSKNPPTAGAATQPATRTPFSFLDPPVSKEHEIDMNDYVLRKGEDIAAKVDRNMMYKCVTDKQTCYVGEPIIASYKFYSRLKSESNPTKNPSFNGFSVIDLDQPYASNSTVEKVGGKEYNVFTIRKSQLYPLRAGNIVLESATIDNNIQFIKESALNNPRAMNDIFGGFSVPSDAVVMQKVALTSKPVTITVLPLPEAGKPASFNGAVGNFTIVTTINKENWTTDEAGVLTVTITGSGNLHLLTAPNINWPEGIDAYDPELEDHLQNSTVPVSGQRTFKISFSTAQAGDYTIPAVEFSYFDPATKSYHTIRSNSEVVHVSQGSRKANLTIGKGTAGNSEGNYLYNHKWWLLGTFGGLVLLYLIIWSSSRKKKYTEEAISTVTPVEEDSVLAEKQEEVRKISPLFKENPLEQSETCLYKNDCAVFYATLNREVKSFLGNALGILPAAIDKRTLCDSLDEKGISTEVCTSMEQLLHDIEFELYTPFPEPEKQEELLQRSKVVVEELKRELRK